MTKNEPPGGVGARMLALVGELYPILRSITGEGVRRTLARLQEVAPLERVSVPSGAPVLDWTVPREWNVRDAFVADEGGRRVIDLGAHTLHLMSYSTPVDRVMSFAELRPHLVSLPDQPDLIPYRTSYYREGWAFCVRHRTLERLAAAGDEARYHVVIDSRLEEGVLDYGELLLPGRRDEEVLFSTHVCHPSLANDNLSGVVVTTFLAAALAERDARRYSYRFLFVPGTIGAIAWLANNEARLTRIRYGLVLSGVGDAGALRYKRTRSGGAAVDRVVEHVLGSRARLRREPFEILPFTPYGYDERQYNSPGFRLPVGRLGRSPHGEYPEYHTSADDLSFVHAEALEGALVTLTDVVNVIEGDGRYLNLVPKGEPQLGRRGLYRGTGGHREARELELATLWVLNLSDGDHTLLDIAERAELPFALVKRAQERLSDHHLLEALEVE